MRDKETPLFRQGKLVAKLIEYSDGRVLLYKANVAAGHIMNMTGAPGWDKHYVDQYLPEGSNGFLRWRHMAVDYDIDIATFREHAFLKEIGAHGEQYHCSVKHYRATNMKSEVDPLRAGAREGSAEEVAVAVALPKKFAFGEFIPCKTCKGVPRKKNPCPDCKGAGYVPAR